MLTAPIQEITAGNGIAIGQMKRKRAGIYLRDVTRVESVVRCT